RARLGWDGFHQTAKFVQRDPPLTVLRWLTALIPWLSARSIVHDLGLRAANQPESDEVVRLTRERDRIALCSLDLHAPAVTSLCIMPPCGGTKEFQIVHGSCPRFTDATNDVPVESEVPAGEEVLKLLDDPVEAPHEDGLQVI